MQRYIRVNDKVPRLVISEFEQSPDDDCRCVILTSQMVTIIRAAVFPSFTYETRVGTWVSPALFLTADEAQRNAVLQVLRDLDYKLTGDEMASCFDVLGQGMSDIAAALAQLSIQQSNNNNCTCGGCCGGSGGANIVPIGQTPDGNTIWGSEPFQDIVEGEGDPPEGFETWEDYFAHKCQVANYLADCLIRMFLVLSTWSVFNVTVLAGLVGVGMGGLIVFPPATIAAFLAAIIALAVALPLMEDLRAYYTENREGLVCDIYSSPTGEFVIDKVIENIDQAIATLALSSTAGLLAKAIAAFVFSTDAVSKLYDASLNLQYPDVECNMCGGSPLGEVTIGSTENIEEPITAVWSEASQAYVVRATYYQNHTVNITVSNYTPTGYHDYNIGSSTIPGGGDYDDIKFEYLIPSSDQVAGFGTCYFTSDTPCVVTLVLNG